MKVKLDRKDLEALVNGSYASYEAMDDPLVQANGYWTGGFVDEWTWSIKKETTDRELIHIYNLCKITKSKLMGE